MTVSDRCLYCIHMKSGQIIPSFRSLVQCVLKLLKDLNSIKKKKKKSSGLSWTLCAVCLWSSSSPQITGSLVKPHLDFSLTDCIWFVGVRCAACIFPSHCASISTCYGMHFIIHTLSWRSICYWRQISILLLHN